MDRAIISEAAKAADFKGGCGGAEPPRMKKVQTFFWLSKQSRRQLACGWLACLVGLIGLLAHSPLPLVAFTSDFGAHS